MKLFKAPILIAILSILFTTACSTTQQAYVRNVQMYFEIKTPISLTADKIKDSPADLVLVKNGERASVTMALAFIENDQYKWVSRDGVMFITQNGRLVRSVGLDHNLLYVSELSNDPLASPALYKENAKWDRVIDTEYGDYGAHLSSQTSTFINQLISVQAEPFMTKKYLETVQYKSPANGQHTWTNTFWFEQSSGQLIKSSQKTSPHSEVVEMIYVSRAHRLLEN